MFSLSSRRSIGASVASARTHSMMTKGSRAIASRHWSLDRARPSFTVRQRTHGTGSLAFAVPKKTPSCLHPSHFATSRSLQTPPATRFLSTTPSAVVDKTGTNERTRQPSGNPPQTREKRSGPKHANTKQFLDLKSFYAVSQGRDTAKLVKLVAEFEAIDPLPLAGFNALIHAYGRLKKIDNVAATVTRMKKVGHTPNPRTYVNLMCAFLWNGMNQRTANTYDELKEKYDMSKVPPLGYNVTIQAYSRMKKSAIFNSDRKGAREYEAKARGVLKEMKKAGVEPDNYTYNALIEGVLSYEDSIVIIDEMVAAGIAPNNFSFNFVLRQAAKQKKRGGTDKGESFGDVKKRIDDTIARMESHGLKPNNYAIINLMEEFGPNGNPLGANLALALAHKHDVTVDTKMYSGMIRAHLSGSSNIKIVQGIFDTMKQQGIVMNSTLYGYYSKAKSRQVLWKDGNDPLVPLHEILAEMKAANVEVLSSVYSEWVYRAAANKRNDVVLELRDLYKAHDKKFHLDTAAYNKVLRLFALDGNFEMVRSYIKEMSEHRVRPTHETYESVITGYARNNRIEDALFLFEEMAEIGHKPSSLVFGDLMKSYATNVDKVAEVLNWMKKMEISATTSMYNEVMFSAVHDTRLFEPGAKTCMTLFQTMVDEGVVPDRLSFSLVLMAQSRVNNYEELERLRRAASEKNIVLSQACYLELLRTYTRKRSDYEEDTKLSVESVKDVLKDMQNHKVDVTVRHFNEILRAVIADDYGAKTMEMLGLVEDLMGEFSIEPDTITSQIKMRGQLEVANPAAVRQLYNDVVAKKMTPNATMESYLVGADLLDQGPDIAFARLVAMRERGILPTSYYANATATRFVQDGRVDDAVEVFRFIWNVPNTLRTFLDGVEDVIKIYLGRGHYRSALDVLYGCKRSGQKPSEKMFDMILDYFAKAEVNGKVEASITQSASTNLRIMRAKIYVDKKAPSEPEKEKTPFQPEKSSSEQGSGESE
eukprot:TRINITY_DN8685_c0_g1_i1.p1 TRINITY_DN8685_c0_g1~~TRINITY_DN8685_c0_g1_i1.p1  ORF type:complete len:988 (+),score=197.04 TRINITY_DN8685_c0_g1_i1:85-3048(+)